MARKGWRSGGVKEGREERDRTTRGRKITGKKEQYINGKRGKRRLFVNSTSHFLLYHSHASIFSPLLG
jgi:hypothetical protein